jgi:RNA polymerase sigma-70 factor (ECF subfamily)
MRSRWEELHAGLRRSIEGRESVSQFDVLRARCAPLVAFGGPAALAAFLVDKGSGLFGRDRALRCLVEEAQRGSTKRTALALLLLGLWPALDSIFRKRSHLFQREAHDIEVEIIDRFIAQVQRIDLGRVSCLAATLVRNTEREVVDARVRERARAAKQDAVTPDVIATPSLDDEPPRASCFGLPGGQSDEAHVASLRRWLLSAVGPDADLIVDAVIHEKSRLDLAASLGISHAAARKRLERALTRARDALLAQPPSQPTAAAAWVRS